MYSIKCDGLVLYDPRGESEGFIVASPKVNLEVNKVGEGSFTIYSNHPYYNQLSRLKSIFEVSDDEGIIFRGRMTDDTVSFDLGKAVDLEGLMAFFNDSVVRPFAFPDDFLSNPDYTSASESGNVIEFFLKWLIDNHNSQVEEFQQFKLGKVTVSDPNNYLYRSDENYTSTWETLKSKLFESALGGYLCIRYEEDGNYIDYLSEFESTNPQPIVFGENLLNLTHETTGTATYTAIIPLGKDKLTISDLPDGDITDDIVKIGDTLYSKSGVERYGWIYAPISETTWSDVTANTNLREKGVSWLSGTGLMLSSTIEITAIDLHFTDSEIQSFRIYRNVVVRSDPHGVSEIYPMPKLGIDIANPQNTKITVGSTQLTLTEQTSNKYDSTTQNIKIIEKATNDLKGQVTETKKTVATFETSINQSSETVEAVAKKTVELEERVIEAESVMRQTAEGFENTVKKDEVISSINQTAEEVKIAAEKIAFDGEMTLDGSFTTTAEVFLEPGQAELDDISYCLEYGNMPDGKNATYYDRDGDGTITENDYQLFRTAANGGTSLATGWSIAEKSTVTVTIDISNPGKAIRIQGVNMWGRSVDSYFGANGISASGNVNMNGNRIKNLPNDLEVDPNDAICEWYARNHYAPGGYGIGGDAGKLITSANEATKTGWYYSIGAMADVPDELKWGLLRNETNLTKQYQTIRCGNKMAIRSGENQFDETIGDVRVVFGDWVDASPETLAPSGYGLGTKLAPTVENVDEATTAGWHQAKKVIIPGIAEDPERWWDVFVACSLLDYSTHQFAFDRYAILSQNGASFLHRSRANAGAWGEWEWINPPMQLDVEYRTSEKFCGRPVYAKIVDCGAFPDANEKIIYHNIDNIEYVISCTGFSDYVGLTLPYYGISNNEIFMYGSVHATSSAITVFTTQSHWQSYKCFAHLKYTKTTD